MAHINYTDSWHSGLYEVENTEWERVIRGFKQHGLSPVAIQHPANVENKSDMVMFTSEMSKRLRDNFQALMKDCERRQELVQELISTNNQLREELKAQTFVSEKYESRVRDLQLMLDTSKLQVEDLHDELNRISNDQGFEDERMKNTCNEVKQKNKELKKKCENYIKEIDRLNAKIKHMADEDKKRTTRQRKVFQQLKQQAGRGHIDSKVLDLIDSYEKQIYDLQQELDYYISKQNNNNNAIEPFDIETQDRTLDEPSYRQREDFLPDEMERQSSHTIEARLFRNEEGSESRDTSHHTGSERKYQSTPQYRELIKIYEKKLTDSQKKQKTLENEVELVKLELQGRPELKDYRDAQAKIKKLERILKKHNLFYLEDNAEKYANKKYSTMVDDIEFLPLYHCRKYLRDVCDAVGVYDLDHIAQKLEKSTKAVEAYPRLQQFAVDVLAVVETHGVPKPPEYVTRSRSSSDTLSSASSHQAWCAKSWQHVVPILQFWVMQLKSLQELQVSINKLSHTLLPWREVPAIDAPPTTTQLIQNVDDILYEEEQDTCDAKKSGTKAREQQTSRAMLQGIVDHFMNLFDVKKITGCYARMNDVYTKLGETHNVLKNLKDLLGLNRDAKSPAIVDAVLRLCEAQKQDTYDRLKRVLPLEDIDSIVRKINIYEDFFPVFQDIMRKLMDILGVSRIDQVVPQVRSIKLISDSLTSRR